MGVLDKLSEVRSRGSRRGSEHGAAVDIDDGAHEVRASTAAAADAHLKLSDTEDSGHDRLASDVRSLQSGELARDGDEEDGVLAAHGDGSEKRQQQSTEGPIEADEEVVKTYARPSSRTFTSRWRKRLFGLDDWTLVNYDSLPDWMKDNDYIVEGHRYVKISPTARLCAVRGAGLLSPRWGEVAHSRVQRGADLTHDSRPKFGASAEHFAYPRAVDARKSHEHLPASKWGWRSRYP